MNTQELNEAKVRAKFYAEHPTETADIWEQHVLDILSAGETTTGLGMDSLISRSKTPKHYKPIAAE